jgi:hypothetical protein
MGALAELAELLRAEGGLIGAVVSDPQPGADESLGAAVAGRGPAYPLVLEAVREGHLLHYGEPRVVRTDDADLALLAGDRLYALGLARLADLGDVESVAVLGDLISSCARAHAEGRDEDAGDAFVASARAIAAGS